MVAQKERTAAQMARYRQMIDRLRLMDDDFMTVVFDNNIEAAQLLLGILLKRSDLIVTEVTAQREYKNPAGRSIKLDILAADAAGKVYNVEVQRSDRGAASRRARYHSSMIDTRLLNPGEDFSKLPDTYVIFITEHDVLGKGLPLYHIERKIEELGTSFGDGTHILYVNGSYSNAADPIGMLMHDFRCTDPEEMYFRPLANKVRYFKQEEGGSHSMCRIFEEYGEEIRKETQEENVVKIIKVLQEFGFPEDIICQKLMEQYELSEEAAQAYLLKTKTE